MNEPNILDQFHLPDGAREDIERQGMTARAISNGVNVISGHQDGIAYKFVMAAVLNENKSRELGYEYYDEREEIQFFVDRKTKPQYEIKYLSPDRLRFNMRDEPVSGAYFEAYKRWKEGREAPGTPLEQWNELSIGEIKTLNSEGIHTVEQFAEMPHDRVKDLFPSQYQEAHEKAQRRLASRDVEVRNKEQADKLLALMEQNKQLAERLEALEAEKTKSSTSAKKRGRPRSESKT